MALLSTHRWPGNVRELENVIEHAFVVEPGSRLTRQSLPLLTHASAAPCRRSKLVASGVCVRAN
jgi:DNA-binding NtrC family response regulator